jgi:hypothetical protein
LGVDPEPRWSGRKGRPCGPETRLGRAIAAALGEREGRPGEAEVPRAALEAALERPEKLRGLPTAKAKGTRMLAGFPEVAAVKGGRAPGAAQ